MSFSSKAGRVISTPVTIPLDYINKMAVFPAKVGKLVLKRQVNGFKDLISRATDRKLQASHPDEQSKAERMRHDSNFFFEQWGIAGDQDLKLTISGLRNEIIAYSLIALYIMWGAILDFTYVDFVLMMSMFPALIIISYTKYWRISCLNKKQFIPFLEWSLFPHTLFQYLTGGRHG